MRFSENLNLPILQDGDKYSKEIQNEAFNTIDRECTSIKNTITSALDISEDVSNAIKTIGDISEELSDLKEKQNEDYLELLESNNYIGNKIRDINSQLDNIVLDNRKLKFKINVSPWWYEADNSVVDNDIELFKKMGVDGFTICVHILNNNNTLYIKEDLNVLLYAVNKIKDNGMSISAIKVHCTQSVFDSASDSFTQYKTLVGQISNKFKNLDIPYFTFLNEVPNIYNNADEKNETLIEELSTSLRTLGFKVGVTFANDKELLDTLNNYSNRIVYYDAFFRNTYPVISYKGKSTTKQDSLNAWLNNENIFYKCKLSYPDMPIILSECGCQHWWECLKNPSRWNWSDTETVTDGQGKVAEVFYYGLFENKSLNDIVDEVWMWYPEQMHYDSFYKFMNNYTKREVR